ncbi:hypothetical protein Pmar_PMAR004701 [Perkinsus marinus ATCC 50983]|uniref:DNA helicase n=1 Tax=Perkinsus marinus (strain ATCC 50983 / TXsc) TaxID=423536 RepID=C5KF48_PERM5|nr:hypothetical protein Pmar_PMAR004701 [Perkinsus marinus ATCC 50983]EER16850.1 hypothetical protein Pmar_PMAR004701 [Perkinsus marinus ATCC 50983]|eukprot:XP_002785054.1 hypothetical protein Pmar_PMAR004701 [Perkinsus marinus ATCC 50983]
MCVQGLLVLNSIRHACFLDENMRTAQQDFRDLLLRVRDGSQTEDENQIFLDRHLHALPAVEKASFAEAVLTTPTRERALSVNRAPLDVLAAGLVNVKAIHSGRGASSATDEIAKGLSSHVQLKVGVPVMLTATPAVMCGLTNGSFGRVAASNLLDLCLRTIMMEEWVCDIPYVYCPC